MSDLAKVENQPLVHSGNCTARSANDSHIVCQEPPVYSYRWDWGESGTCCAQHAFVLRQLAEQLGRTVTLSALDPHARPPITRDERTELNAMILTLQSELKEAKERGLQLYEQNSRLAQQAQAAVLRAQESAAQLARSQEAEAEAEAEAERRTGEAADARDEAERLKAIMPRIQELQADNERLRRERDAALAKLDEDA